MVRCRSGVRRRRDRWSGLAGKRRWTAEEARLLLETQCRSGQSLAAFSRQHGLPLPRLYDWRRRLSEAAAGAVAPRFLPVRIVSTGGVAELAQGSGMEIVLDGGHRIRFASTFDPAALARVIEILERPAC